MLGKNDWKPNPTGAGFPATSTLTRDHRSAVQAAPPIYRPGIPNPVQTRMAPPVFRPEHVHVAQRKAAPPVYRPNSMPPQARMAPPPVYKPGVTTTIPPRPTSAASSVSSKFSPEVTTLASNFALRPVQRMAAGPQAFAIPVRVQAGTNMPDVLQLQKKRKRADDDDDEYLPSKKRPRFTFPKGTEKKVTKRTAHRRKHVNARYKRIYTCRVCRRPLAAVTLLGEFVLTRYAYTSQSGKLHKQRALELDHHRPWAERHEKLVKKHASDQEIKDDHNDPDQLRALCRVCNGSHKFEGKDVADYESDDDDPGYFTDDEEPDNKGNYADYRYDPPPGGAGVMAM